MPLIIIIQSAITAIVFVNVLTAPDGLLQNMRSHFLFFPDRIQHVVFGCAKCQAAYWLIIYSLIWIYFGNPFIIQIIYGLIDTIFIAYMLGLIANKLSR